VEYSFSIACLCWVFLAWGLEEARAMYIVSTWRQLITEKHCWTFSSCPFFCLSKTPRILTIKYTLPQNKKKDVKREF
jgi:hypothetical protein